MGAETGQSVTLYRSTFHLGGADFSTPQKIEKAGHHAEEVKFVQAGNSWSACVG